MAGTKVVVVSGSVEEKTVWKMFRELQLAEFHIRLIVQMEKSSLQFEK